MTNYEQNNDHDDLIKQGTEIIEKSADPPDISPDDSDVSTPTVQTYNAALEAEVLSRGSLESSREYCIRLIAALPENFSKTDLTVKLIEQEIQLQSSIKNRHFTDLEMISNVRRWLALVIGFATVVLAISAFAYASFHHATVDVMLGFSKWMFGYAAATVLGFYFPKIAQSVADGIHKLKNDSKPKSN